MTFGELKDEVALRLGVDGTSIYDYTNWDAAAIRALKRYVDEFIIGARYRWVRRATLTLVDSVATQDISSSGVAIPEVVWINDKRITRVEGGAVGNPLTTELEEGAPTHWAWYDGNDYKIELDRAIDATTNNGDHYVSGWGGHPAYSFQAPDTEDDVVMYVKSPSHLEYMIDYIVYRMMRGTAEDETSLGRAEMYGKEAVAFMERQAAINLASRWNDAPLR